MSTSIPITEFAPAERVPIEVTQRQAAAFARSPLASELLNSTLNVVFILNAQRQIIFVSQNVAGLAPVEEPSQLLGMRPGEALGCVHAIGHGGCGTTAFCRHCGAAQAILAGIEGRQMTQECRMTRVIRCGTEALDLLVSATPFALNGEAFTLFAAVNISHEKRRRVFERIFFHDAINVAGGLTGLVEMLQASAPESMQPDLALVQTALQGLLEEILAQKDLVAAEANELAVTPVLLRSEELLHPLLALFRNHEASRGRQLILAPGSDGIKFVSDRTLLRRVLANLVKNALEAISEGQAVTLSCQPEGDHIRLRVHNPTLVPLASQLQIFNRSFSTKGEGRGLGTYSVRLLAERYLRGSVHFTTSAAQGTTFTVLLPPVLSVRARAVRSVPLL